MSRSKSGMGGSKSSKSKSSGDKPHEIHIKRAHGGGFVVTHHKKKKQHGLMDDNEPQEHVVPDADQLQAHVQDAMGDQPAAGQGPAEQPAPQGAPQPPMAGM